MSIALNTVVYNEAQRILGLLTHAAEYCDELVIVDDSSTDATADLARDFGATVIVIPHRGICEPSRAIAAEHTSADWILCLDADEVLADFVVAKLSYIQAAFKGAKLPRLNLVDGEPITAKLDAQYRLFERGNAIYGQSLHTRIEPRYGPTFTPQTPGWIIHSKSQAEWEADDLHYRSLACSS